jgi:hypothetical protein
LTTDEKLLAGIEMRPATGCSRTGVFYSGARCVLKVLDHVVEGGEADELRR